MPLFHLAFPVTDLQAAHRFYVDLLGAAAGRAAENWADFEFHGHQLSAHRVDTMPEPAAWSDVDGKAVPIPHFGLVLQWDRWEQLAARLIEAGQEFLLRPGVRFAGETGEQGTFFLQDPSGNALEFKAFRRPEEAFA